MRSIGKVVRFVLVLVSIMAIFPAAASLAQGQQPIAKGVARWLGVPIFKGNGNDGLVQIGSTWLNGQQVDIYSYKNMFYGQEYAKTDPNFPYQFIRLSDLWVLTGNETKSDIRLSTVIITPEYKSLGEGSGIRYYNKPSYPSYLIVAAVIPAALDGPLPFGDMVAAVLISGSAYIAYQNSPTISASINRALGQKIEKIATSVQGVVGLELWAAEEFQHHVLEGTRADNRVSLLTRTSNLPCAECWYRWPGASDEAIALIIRTDSYKSGNRKADGVIFIHNRSNPSRSTLLVGSQPPLQFSTQLPLTESRCREAMAYMANLAKKVLQ